MMSRRFVVAAVAALVLSACGETVGTVTDQAKQALSGAVAPVREAADEVSRRANEVGEGINDVRGGIRRVKGAFSGSGSTW